MGFGNELLITIKAKDQASNTLNRIRGNLKEHASAFKAAGKRMLIASAALTAGLGIAVNQAAKFQQQMAQVSTMLDQQSMKHMPLFEKKIKSMSIEFGEATSTLADGLYNILSASIPAAEAMDVLDVSVKAAKGGLTDTGTAADAITTILNSYQLSAEKAADVSDLLFTIVKRGKLTFAQLAPNIGKVAAMAANAGMSLEELGATIATLTRNGIRTEMAMTGIRGVLNGLMGATEESAKIFKDKLGLAMETATLKTHGFVEILKRIKEARMTPEEIKKMFPNVRGLIAIVAAMGDLEGVTKDVALMTDRAGAAQVAFEKNFNTTETTLLRLKEAMNILAVEIGTKLLPIVDKIAKKIISLVKWYQGLEEGTKKIVSETLLWTAGLLALSGSLLLIAGMLPGMIKSFIFLSSVLKVLAAKALIATAAMTAGLGAAFVFTGLKLTELYFKTKEYIVALKEQARASEQASDLQTKAFSRTLMKFGELKDKFAGMGEQYIKRIAVIEELRTAYEEQGASGLATTEQQIELQNKIIEKIQEMMGWERERLIQQREIANEKNALDEEISDNQKTISEEDIESYRKVYEEKELLDLKGFKRKQKRLVFEKKQRKKDVRESITSETLKKDALLKIDVIYKKKGDELTRQEVLAKRTAALNIAGTTLDMLKNILEAEGSSAKKKKAIIIALMSAELALGITRMWSAEASKGVLGIAPAVVGTAALVANYAIQMHNLTKGTSSIDSGVPSVSADLVGIKDESQPGIIDDDTVIISRPSQGNTGVVSGGNGGVTRVTNIEVGGIDINLGGINVTEENLESTLREISEAVKSKTVEAITMAMRIYNVGREADINEEAV